jgi:glycosyltransferase involved in cell wall biosynthesis
MEYVFFSKLTSVFPRSVRTVIDMHDLFGNRHEHYLNNKMQPTWFATTANQEIRALKRADAVIAIQDEESQYLKRRGVNEVHCVGHLLTPQPIPLPDPGGARLLFVGSGNPINVQGLEWFLSSVMPRIRRAFPNCELAVAGPVSQRRVWPDEVLALGELNSLATEYEKATVVINPVKFGTGLAVKTVEALSYGKAVVATDAGARGLGSEFSAVLSVAEDASTFAEHVIELLRDTRARVQRSRNAIAITNAWLEQQLTSLDLAVRG